MAQLNLPNLGPIYLDSCVFIYSVEKVEPYRTILEPLWFQAGTDGLTLLTSELTIAEVLVRPIREGNQELARVYRELFQAPGIRLIPATRRIWEEAARLRAQTNLRTPDAVHGTTALEEGCTTFITNDGGFRRVEDLNVTVLQEALPTE